jgi:hypothetical protein
MGPPKGNLLASIEAFVKYASKNKLWVFAASLFAICGSFAINFYTQLPTQLAEIERNAVKFELYRLDSERVLEVYDVMLNAYQSGIQAGESYSGIISDIKQGKTPSADEWVTAIQKVTDARRQLAVAVGTVQGAEFHDARYSVYKDGFVQDISRMDEALSVIENFLLAGAANDIEKAKAYLDENKSNDIKYSQYEAEAQARAKSFNELGISILQENQIEVAEKTANARLFTIKFYLTIPAIIYEAAFVIIAYRSWIKHRNHQKKSEVRKKKGRA